MSENAGQGAEGKSYQGSENKSPMTFENKGGGEFGKASNAPKLVKIEKPKETVSTAKPPGGSSAKPPEDQR